uniref:Rho-GAP domain-containing protein n=1 Tax=Paramoeba aestuarina TaxID=180227 RepID=A0A7S4JK79_9EUKA
MSAANMGTVMAPNLFHKTVKTASSSPQDLMVSCNFDDMKLTSDVFVFMTENYKYLFDENPVHEPPPPPKSLIDAVRDHDVELVRRLVEVDNVDPNMVDSETGDSALNILVALERPRVDCIQILVDGGADINMVGADGLPPVFRVVAPQRKDALLCLIELGANTSQLHSVDGSPKTLLDHVSTIDPSQIEDVQHLQRVIARQSGNLLSLSQDSPNHTPIAVPSAQTQPQLIQKGRRPKTRSSTELSGGRSPNQRPVSQFQLQPTPQTGQSRPLSTLSSPRRASHGALSLSPLYSPSHSPNHSPQASPPSSPLPSAPYLTLTPLRSAPSGSARGASSPQLSSIPPPLVGSPQADSPKPLSGPSSPGGWGISSPSFTPSSPALTPSQIPAALPEASKKSTSEHTISVQPVYRRIALDPLVEALGSIVVAGCHAQYQQDAVEQTNASLAHVAQPLKQLFSNSETSIRNFNGFSEASDQAIARAGQDLQGSAKRMVQSARQVYSTQTDASQAAFASELHSFVGSVRQLLLACDKAGFDVILAEAQSLTKSLKESLSYVKSGDDPQSFKDINSPATFCVLRFNHMVKTLAFQLPDGDCQSKLNQSCATIASCTVELSREALTLMAQQAQFRNLAPVGTKAKAIIMELQSINSVIHTPLAEKYVVPPSGDALRDLQSQGEIAINRACLVLARAGDDEVFHIARETLPSLFLSLFANSQGDRRKLMESTLAFVKATKGAACRAEEIASSRGMEQRISIYSHALEHLFRLAVVSVASYCVAPFGGVSESFPVPSLPYVGSLISTCFFQLLASGFPNE